MTKLHFYSLTVLLLLSTWGLHELSPVSSAQEENPYQIEMDRRINAHGNEFMCLALTSDAKRLIIGTESGAILVWGIAENRIIKELDTGSGVHAVVTLKDPDYFIAAGGPHIGVTEKGYVQKWSIKGGTFEELVGPNASTFLQLSADRSTGFVAASAADGSLVVWNTDTRKLESTVKFGGVIVGLALAGQDLYVTGVDPEMEDDAQNAIWKYSKDKLQAQPVKLVSESDNRIWGDLQISPSGRVMAAKLLTEFKERVVLIEISTARTLAEFDASAAAWSANGSAVLFASDIPIKRISVDSNGGITESELLKAGTWHGAGQPANMTGQVVSPDGSKAWEIFQLNATLGEIDLNKKSTKSLLVLLGNVYTFDVSEEWKLLATGGDDEFVRVRRLSDLTLIKEFRVKPGVPQGVALMENGQQVVFSASAKDTKSVIYSGDLKTGSTRVILEMAEPSVKVVRAHQGFIYDRPNKLVLARADGTTVREFSLSDKVAQFAVSANGEWLAVSNEKGNIDCFEIKTGKQTLASTKSFDSLTRLTISNDGRIVYTTEFQAGIRRLDTKTDTTTDVTSIRGQARTLSLSSDEKWIAVGGNHRDLQVYDANNGDEILNLRVPASDFYVTNVWVNQSRVIFTTDAGVMFDGRLVRTTP
jgi:WD40 repeat protein